VESQLELAQAQQKQALAELNELKIRRAQTRIYAPMDGSIAQRFVDVGALVNASTPIVSLVNLATMVVVANVPESEIGKLRPGLGAEIELDAFGEETFRGRVARIGPVLDAATRSANVEIEIPNPDRRLRGEMFARVKLDIATTRQAVLIPREALVYRGTQPGVYLITEGDQPEFRNVETGITHGNEVEITANLQAGARVVATGASMLTEGDRIRVGGGGKKKSASE
jgi:RND family efflux transporter MFP subunit